MHSNRYQVIREPCPDLSKPNAADAIRAICAKAEPGRVLAASVVGSELILLYEKADETLSRDQLPYWEHDVECQPIRGPETISHVVHAMKTDVNHIAGLLLRNGHVCVIVTINADPRHIQIVNLGP